MAITLTLPTPPAIKLPRIVWIGIGVVCISLLIWLLGPLIGWGSFAPLASWKARLGLIAVIIAVVAGVYVWRRIKAQKANDAMIRDLAQPAADPDEDLSAADVKAMEERATKALALMRDGRVGREQELVYELPWYVIIGPPGAGKTTALQNAGLHFPASQSLGAAPIRESAEREPANGGSPIAPC